jgi:NADPH:quinone reductase-like Zn-dependent oxidoreductase
MRHDDDSLRGQTIFVSGGMSVIGQAAIHLAIILGAKKVSRTVDVNLITNQYLNLYQVYASAMKKDHRHLKRLGAIPVYLSEDLTFAGLEDKIDLFVDFTAYNEFQGLTVVKEGSGRVVYYHLGDIGEEGKHGTRSQLENFFLKIR